MCSIIGGFGNDVVSSLVALNSHRGTVSSSYTLFDERGYVLETCRFAGPLKNIPTHSGYIVCHQQAPTSSASGKNIHPSTISSSLLWHNGILKQHFLKKLQADTEWDTHVLHKLIAHEGIQSVENVEGSFACLYHNEQELMMFRNSIAPLWYHGATISSVKFEHSNEIMPNTVYKLNFKARLWVEYSSFSNIEMPFYFAQ